MSDPPIELGIDGEEEGDPGEPIAALAGFQENASPTLLGSVRRNIYRRSAISHIASFSWNIPKLVLTEFWKFLLQFTSKNDTASKGGGQS